MGKGLEIKKICRHYETAVRIDPTNEELHTHLFMSYVRISDFKLQQQSAMALYKLKPKNPYYCWAVMSIILQATRGEGCRDPLKRKLLLSLAERMFDKLLTENKIDAEQKVQLYVMILDFLGKQEEVVAVLDGPLGAKLQCTNFGLVKMTYLKKNAEVERCQFDLQKHSCREENYSDGGDNIVETADDTPEKAHEFICRMVESGADNARRPRCRHICAVSPTVAAVQPEHLKALITALNLHYQHGYQTYGRGMLISTDLAPCDPYALLAAHLLYDLAQIEQKSDAVVVVALALLERLLSNSPSNFHGKLLAVRLYHCLGKRDVVAYRGAPIGKGIGRLPLSADISKTICPIGLIMVSFDASCHFLLEKRKFA
ncbi:unnamed protein product [Phaedon cochleariae]|uniref:N-terminal acetyltransferase B complex subunit NAA25 homolog n=1 Tax=Phaedon cochleariae TaxID=80249 RepID=A0A9N9S6T6_PHACE|nr:unnamed protein product [Phaedon cochleariae]